MALTWIRTHDWDADAWRNRAACRDTSPELFFPIGTTGVALDQIDAAKRVCESCPVTSECLEFALATNQEAGVWGGLTEDERRRVRKGIDVVVENTPASQSCVRIQVNATLLPPLRVAQPSGPECGAKACAPNHKRATTHEV